jgi:hypothetical protein
LQLQSMNPQVRGGFYSHRGVDQSNFPDTTS